MIDRVLVDYGAVHDANTVRWLSSADLRATFGFSGDISIESHRRWVEAARDTHLWAVLNTAGQHCGNTLVHVNPRHRSGYLQMYIGEQSARGLGLGSAALHETLVKAFQALALHRVWLHTLPGNLAAQALYRKHGFVSEGFERESIRTDGGFISQDRWSILAGEWRSASRASPT